MIAAESSRGNLLVGALKMHRVWPNHLAAAATWRICCAFLFLWASALVLVQKPALADSEIDDLSLREIYRYDPEFAEDLTEELKAASNPEERERVIEQYKDRLANKKEIWERTPETIRNPDFGNYISAISFALYYMLLDHPDVIITKGWSNLQTLEDDIISEIGLDGSKELYDWLRWKYPKDVGYHYLRELEELKEKDTEKYLDRLEMIKKSLDNFRTKDEPLLPKSERMAPLMEPLPPLPPCKKTTRVRPTTGKRIVITPGSRVTARDGSAGAQVSKTVQKPDCRFDLKF